MVDPWIGPAIIAAIVSGLVSAAGWFVSSWQDRRHELQRREEKIHDFQVALRAEIASDVLGTTVFDRREQLRAVREKYALEPGYTVLVPHLSANVVFDAIVDDIPILPGEVIGPIVHYQRMRQTLERFAGDLRADSFAKLPPERQLAMYSDYLDMIGRVELLAQRALVALENSLGLSTPDADRLTPPSAPEGAGADEVPASVSQKTSPTVSRASGSPQT